MYVYICICVYVYKNTYYRETDTSLEDFGETYRGARWERMHVRHEAHNRAVERVMEFIERLSRETNGMITYKAVRRESLSCGDFVNAADYDREVDLVIALGGDGTTLISSHFIHSNSNSNSNEKKKKKPKLIGVNTDPAFLAPCLTFTKKAEDERRSTGFLCAASANDVEDVLKEIIFDDDDAVDDQTNDDGDEHNNNINNINSNNNKRVELVKANRISIKVNGKSFGMPLALNDVLICHNSPAALSRYSIMLDSSDLVREKNNKNDTNNINSFKDVNVNDDASTTERAFYHIRSSGVRFCTGFGSTAAMKSAGGHAMPRTDQRIQYMDREPIYYDHEAKPPGKGNGFYGPEKISKFRWNTRVGKIFIDGANVCRDLKIGDEIEIASARAEDHLEIFQQRLRK
jgi:NAD+ kinase